MSPSICSAASPLRRRLALYSLLVLATFGATTALTAAEIVVGDMDNLQARIDAAQGGDVLLLGNGPYAGFTLEGRHFTAERPLVIRPAPGARPVLRGQGYTGYLAKITNTSYVVLDGLTLTRTNQPIYSTSVEHLILVNLHIHDIGQEAIHIRGQSRHIDIRDCRIYDSGHTQPQWAEGIYIGMGQPPFESVEHVWIEGNDIARTGNSEAINLKARVYHVTIRGNRVHDLAPGTATQHNEAAVSCEAADRSYRPGEDPDVWIERNEIFDVRFGRWANGIKLSTMGGRVIGNTIRDCAQHGIAFNAYDNGPGAFPAWLFDNRIERCAAGAISGTVLQVRHADPGPNPNRPQTWYRASPPASPARQSEKL
ncbi:right-handed parallel beta-helix repeat-containing protein [Opitutus terrae]|uniref:Parallel beta-helix repeat n=1 Tax=Opitutus terrae (strain DSM 11246 / JCM 15787 / PB90-1) TaxID=452637 RepID=B1ZMP9_OPITP|nr:right-handed parallel beta-helix repeat-containing protein [Opitutus terrae]ACB75327.1 Parallel beta-helix repeat [Opitutus terrae PB90-1]